MNRPRLSQQNLWSRHETFVLASLALALAKLRVARATGDLPQGENDLNRLLYFYLIDAAREIAPLCVLPLPVYEAYCQPRGDDVDRASREDKRPDFQWGYIDPHERDPRRCARILVIECKRLGEPTSATWVLNRNYVNHGLIRFREITWGYGDATPSAAMVGYVQSMTHETVLQDVNEAAHAADFPVLVIQGGVELAGIRTLENRFDREFSESPFTIRHLWVDLA